MLIVLLLICIGLAGLCVYIGNSDDWDFSVKGFIGVLGTTISAIAALICIGFILDCCVHVTEFSIIDDRIAMYQEENEKIETQISEVVSEYQQYETNTFTELAPDKAVSLISLYPELKSDILVQKQIETYVANNQKIKELRDERLYGDVYRWWLYFGGE